MGDWVYIFIFLKIDSGIADRISMTYRQNQGRYTMFFLFFIAFRMPLAIVSGFAQSNPFLKSAVMGVSTNPGFTVMT